VHHIRAAAVTSGLAVRSIGCNRKNGKEITVDARCIYYGNTVAASFAKYINSAGKVVSDSSLPAATQELVKIRASQINGCAYCTDMHTKVAAHAGDTSLRLPSDGLTWFGRRWPHRALPGTGTCAQSCWSVTRPRAGACVRR
jgi:AhpD family alkylhydroperoxidase